MKRTIAVACLAAAAFLVAAAIPARLSAAAPTPVEQGKYLVNLGGCHDCHTPKKMGPQGPEPDPSRLLAGHPEAVKVTGPTPVPAPWMAATTMDQTAWSGPWGVSFAANLTPDQNTGMGIWTEEMFVKAMRTGKHMGTSRTILPPMPWPSIGKLTDADLKAIYAYLRSIPPVKNRIPEPLPPPAAPGGGR